MEKSMETTRGDGGPAFRRPSKDAVGIFLGPDTGANFNWNGCFTADIFKPAAV